MAPLNSSVLIGSSNSKEKMAVSDLSSVMVAGMEFDTLMVNKLTGALFGCNEMGIDPDLDTNLEVETSNQDFDINFPIMN
ncbi:hypothetical protein G9A89_014366 [Geosiphon pyriformis]|nr:hypothetical protein G9A89_014366 [Geosiphon pyriformis]